MLEGHKYFHWGERRARRALKGLHIAGLLDDFEDEDKNGDEGNDDSAQDGLFFYRYALAPVASGASGASGASEVVEVDEVVPTPDGSQVKDLDTVRSVGADADADADAPKRTSERMRVTLQAIREGRRHPSIHAVHKHFHWGQAKATRVLRALREAALLPYELTQVAT